VTPLILVPPWRGGVSVYLAKGGQMLVAYLDEVAEAGAFVSKTHKNYGL